MRRFFRGILKVEFVTMRSDNDVCPLSFMPIYHFSVKNISRNHSKTKREKELEYQGIPVKEKPPRSAIAAAAYRSGTRLVDEVTGKVYNYERKTGVFHTEILTPDDAPFWVGDRSSLWNAVEQENWRKNARFAKEITIALPKELSNDAKLGLVREFVTAEIVTRFNLVADVCYHNFESNNPHVHLMIPTRVANAESFGDRVKAIDERKTVYELRTNWANYCNKFLKNAGIRELIDHRSLKEQGIEREPQINIGAAAWAMEKREVRTKPGERYREIEARNREREQVREYDERDRQK